jgi:ribosomal protein S18 acetylase RimI-like enzyme
MINLRLHIRRAVAQDHRQISSLILHESNTHRHLDWRAALDWIGVRNFWVLEENGTIISALACPEDPPDVAWIRLFSYHTHHTGPENWSALWEAASAEMFSANPRTQVASIVMKHWFQTLLLSSGFEARQNIVLLDLHSENYRPARANEHVRIRPMQAFDLPDVEQIDLAAFGAFWHNTADALQLAHAQAYHSTVAELDGQVIGYQISTGNPFGAHLARLGVRPEAQGRGIGSALIHELIQRGGALQSGRLSVNTQEDNNASLRLYHNLGFTRTGEYYPVFVKSPGSRV